MRFKQFSLIEGVVRRIHQKWISPNVSNINNQRIKLVWFIWGYYPFFFMNSLSLKKRLKLLYRFLKIDWNIPHGHRPLEISLVCKELAKRQAENDEIFMEMGCWKGGSSTKFSIICKILGYRLSIYDSFEGVEPMSDNDKIGTYDYTGEYASPMEALVENLQKYGEPDVCDIHKGWFKDTLASNPVSNPVRGAFIDCDLAKGTKESLDGIMPLLVSDGFIFSQDYHIEPVRQFLHALETWEKYKKGIPKIRFLAYNLAIIKFDK